MNFKFFRKNIHFFFGVHKIKTFSLFGHLLCTPLHNGTEHINHKRFIDLLLNCVMPLVYITLCDNRKSSIVHYVCVIIEMIRIVPSKMTST